MTRLRAALLIAAAGAIVILADLFGDAGEWAALVAMAVGTLLSAGDAPRSRNGEPNWWALLALGTVMALAGVPLSLLLETPGGLLAGVGSALVVAAVALGLP